MAPGPRVMPQKAKNFKKSIFKLLKYCKRHVWGIVISLIFAVAGTILTLIGPNKIKELTDIITQALPAFDQDAMQWVNTNLSVDLQAVTNIGIILVILYGLGAIFSFIQGFIMTTITQRLSKRMRKDITSKINNLPLSYMDSTPHGDVLSRVTNDVDTIGQTLANSIVTLVSASTLLIGSIIMMFITNPIMAATAIGASLIGFILIALIMRFSQKHFVAQQNELGAINAHIEEIYSGHDIVNVYNGKKETKKKFEQINKRLYVSGWKSQFFSGLMGPIMGFVGDFGYVAVCVVGAVLTMSGSISFGVIVAFMIYVRLFNQPLAQLAQAFNNLQSTAAASERVFEFLDAKELDDESHKTTVLNDAKGDVEFEHVKFGYTPDRVIIHDFSTHVKAGQKVAIVGPTGAGKTTLVNLLMRFYEVDAGKILIDGVDTKDLTRENIHNLFSMVLQDTWLFEGTVKDNIVYSKEGVTDEQVIAACKACGLHHFIKSLPHGYNSVLDDNTSISAGQRQLMTIARAMIEDSPMLILDEATSSVDTRTEILIQKAMDKLTENRTSFVIAHRLSTIKNADLILVMNNGDIVEQGTHKDLLSKGGFYADLYNSQFDKED